MVDRNEVWAQGSQPGEPPISSVLTPIPPEIVELDRRRERLQTARNGGVNPANMASLLQDLIDYLVRD